MFGGAGFSGPGLPRLSGLPQELVALQEEIDE